MKYLKLTGVIINRRALKDNDRFLTIYTKEEGKLSVYARGIRSIKSKRGSQLDLFSHISFEIFEKNDRRTLTSVELLSGHYDSKGSLSNISRLFQIGELVDKLTEEGDPHLAIYELLVTALTHLSRFETEEYLLRFKKKLLLELGYGEAQAGDIDVFIDSLIVHPLSARKIL